MLEMVKWQETWPSNRNDSCSLDISSSVAPDPPLSKIDRDMKLGQIGLDAARP